jgi:hypothetical protein
MPKSRKRKGANKYRPDPRVKKKRDPVENMVILNAKSIVMGSIVRDALRSDDPEVLEKALTKLRDASEEAHDFASMPLRAMVGPAEGKADH